MITTGPAGIPLGADPSGIRIAEVMRRQRDRSRLLFALTGCRTPGHHRLHRRRPLSGDRECPVTGGIDSPPGDAFILDHHAQGNPRPVPPRVLLTAGKYDTTTGHRNHSFHYFLAALIGCGLWTSIPVFGQATGQITGLITDPSGGVVPGAGVELTSETTGQSRSVTSGTDGFYTIPLVNPGKYRIRVSKTGFNTSVEEGIEVSVNGTARVDFPLSVGQVSEQVVVTAAATLVETRNATLGVVIDQQKVVELPLNGRNFAQLGTLLPGVVAPPASSGRPEWKRDRRRFRQFHRQFQRQWDAQSVQQLSNGRRRQQ